MLAITTGLPMGPCTGKERHAMDCIVGIRDAFDLGHVAHSAASAANLANSRTLSRNARTRPSGASIAVSQSLHFSATSFRWRCATTNDGNLIWSDHHPSLMTIRTR